MVVLVLNVSRIRRADRSGGGSRKGCGRVVVAYSRRNAHATEWFGCGCSASTSEFHTAFMHIPRCCCNSKIAAHCITPHVLLPGCALVLVLSVALNTGGSGPWYLDVSAYVVYPDATPPWRCVSLSAGHLFSFESRHTTTVLVCFPFLRATHAIAAPRIVLPSGLLVQRIWTKLRALGQD